ncbi:hypothetical protein C8Q72DRAFT_925512 [Fomitopsis betulina]|nr:hypothetical protein C8Q72DRAFT_925512 [Fomitopsis betulina]
MSHYLAAFNLAPLSPDKDVLLLTAVLALLTHAWFKKYELTDVFTLSVLLGILPSLPVALSALHALLSSTIISKLSAYLAFYVFLLLSITAYCLSPFHPLYQYPGPYLAKLSNFYSTYIAASGKQHLHFERMHEKYGPIVRLGPNVLLIVDVDLLPSLLNLPRGPMWDGRRISGKCGQGIAKGNLIGARNMQIHADARKVWNRAFTTTSVKKYEPIVIRGIAQLVDELKAHCRSQCPTANLTQY